jgi:hypothetical protein
MRARALRPASGSPCRPVYPLIVISITLIIHVIIIIIIFIIIIVIIITYGPWTEEMRFPESTEPEALSGSGALRGSL